jgi:NAD(P)-dependent dehydrogenase (short-subunit alcohol dehydrogenase family)
MTTTLTAGSTIGDWLEHPQGGPLIRAVLGAQGGFDESMLAPVRGLPLQQLVAMSQGQLPQSVVDDLVLQVNGGVAPEEAESSAWAERITPGRFDGRTVIVTGAASGIGRATASRVAREGGRVVAVDVNADRLAELASSVPGAVVTVAGDITKQDDIDRIIAAADGRIDALANVAGINDDFSPAGETTDAVWDRVIAINLTGAFKLLRAALPAMVAAGRGSVVNVASEAGLRGNASGNAYTVSKHGVIGLTRSAAFMYGPQGIRVNAVAPGGVATGIPFPPNVSEAGSARLGPFQAAIPTVATAEQLAASITFLLSDDGVNINGAVLASDGGWSVQ